MVDVSKVYSLIAVPNVCQGDLILVVRYSEAALHVSLDGLPWIIRKADKCIPPWPVDESVADKRKKVFRAVEMEKAFFNDCIQE